tara:strand:- start:780 stop:2423 length:1644 start_codon:yes stop_codon:yes gene_type:complete
MKTFCISKFPFKGRHIIEASAGTGKTYALMEIAYRALFKSKIKPQDIVLMTFTRASTQELKNRLYDKINDSISTELNKKTSEIRNLKLLESIKKEINLIDITTIHSFANNIISQLGPFSGKTILPIESPPNFQEQITRDFYYSRLKKNQNNPIFSEALRGLKTFTEVAYKILQNPFDATNPPEPKSRQQSLNEISERLKKAKQSRFKLESIQNVKKNVLNAHLDFIEKSFVNSCIEVNDLEKAFRYLKKIQSKIFNEESNFAIGNYIDLQAPSLLISSIRASSLKDLQNHYIKESERRGFRDYNSIVKTAVSILSSVDPQMLSQSYFIKKKIVLVDEFQDTDKHQWELIDSIFPNSANRLLVLIGDPKQSIYGFRGADSNWYSKIKKTISQNNHWSLTTVYRSNEHIINGLNQLFSNAPFFSGNMSIPKMRVGRALSVPNLIFNGSYLSGINWIISDPKKLESIENKTIHLCQTLLTRKKNHKFNLNSEPVKAQDICILVRKRSTAEKIKRLGTQHNLLFDYQNNISVFQKPIAYDFFFIVTRDSLS